MAETSKDKSTPSTSSAISETDDSKAQYAERTFNKAENIFNGTSQGEKTCISSPAFISLESQVKDHRIHHLGSLAN